MITRDGNFLKYLKLTHEDVATALGFKRPSITEGVNKKSDYFDRTKLSKIAAFLKDKDGYDSSKVDEARHRYLTDPTAFTDGPSIIGEKPRDWDFTQLWTVGTNIEEVSDPNFIDDLLGPREDLVGQTLVYVVPDEETGENIFRRFSKRLKGKLDCINVYILEFPPVRYLPSMRIVDPQSDSPKSYVRLFDGSLGRASEDAGVQLIRFFQRKGLGISGDDFYGESSPEILGTDVALLYGPTDFHRG
ncbi:MAG: hypothetical protein V4689_12725 [Verrucomicrobiota bacterium]